MCPDDALLSAYYDGEISSPWKEKIENHLKECSRCKEKLAAFGSQSAALQNDPEPEYESSFDDLQKIIRRKENIRPVRSFPVPLPAVPLAAAAAAVLAFFLGFSMAGDSGPSASFSEIPLAVSEGWSIPPGDLVVSGEDIEAMLSLIDQGSSVMFQKESSMELPVDLNLALIGESELVRTVSYAGGSSR